MKNKGGRPAKFTEKKFYVSLVRQNDDFSYAELAKMYNVSVRTIARWIAHGKELVKNE